MGTVRGQYQPKESNVKKLLAYLSKVENKGKIVFIGCLVVLSAVASGQSPRDGFFYNLNVIRDLRVSGRIYGTLANAPTLSNLSQGIGIMQFVYDGSSAQTVNVDTTKIATLYALNDTALNIRSTLSSHLPKLITGMNWDWESGNLTLVRPAGNFVQNLDGRYSLLWHSHSDYQLNSDTLTWDATRAWVLAQGYGTGGGSPWTTSGTSIYYNAGNVGINTASPSYLFDVQGSAWLTRIYSTNLTADGFNVGINNTSPDVALHLGAGTVYGLVYGIQFNQGTRFYESAYKTANINNFASLSLGDIIVLDALKKHAGAGTTGPNSTFHINGDKAERGYPQIIGWDFDISTTGNGEYVLYYCNPEEGDLYITLPPLSECDDRIYYIYNLTGTSALVNIRPSGTDKIMSTTIYALRSRQWVMVHNSKISGMGWGVWSNN